MFKNIDLSEINKNSVLKSAWLLEACIVSFFSISVFLLYQYNVLPVLEFSWSILGSTFMLLVVPLISFGLEYLVIRQSATERTVILAMVAELMLFSGLLLLFKTSVTITLVSVGCLALAQGIRYFYLKLTNRMFSTAETPHT